MLALPGDPLTDPGLAGHMWVYTMAMPKTLPCSLSKHGLLADHACPADHVWHMGQIILST